MLLRFGNDFALISSTYRVARNAIRRKKVRRYAFASLGALLLGCNCGVWDYLAVFNDLKSLKAKEIVDICFNFVFIPKA